jgi:tetratricopeptide (TPR) repeat protein
MSWSRWKAVTVVSVLILLAMPTVLAQGMATSAMSVCHARRTVVTELQRVGACRGKECFLGSLPSDVAFDAGKLLFQAEPNIYKELFPIGIYKIDLKALGEVTNGGSGSLNVDGRNPLWGEGAESKGSVKKNLSNASILGFLAWPSFADARAFADALNTLRLYARTYDASRELPPFCFADKEEQARIWAEFQKRAATWRALPAKPAISDDVKQHRLLAEDAYQQKQFDTAAAEYEAGLEIDPLWAQGHFNAAVIYGELKDYDDAVWHMRCYLELLPNAPDAQDARDQMLLWQGKAKQQSATQ